MKKLLTLFALAVLCCTSAMAETTRVYCKMAYSWWTTDNAAIGVYVFDNSTSSYPTAWPGVRMTSVDALNTIWYADVDLATYPNFNFNRINSSGDVANWGAQTNDLTFPTDGTNLYTITSSEAVWASGGGKVSGAWSTYSPTYYIKTNFGGGSEWAWKQLTKDENSNPETWSVKAVYGGSGCNWNNTNDDNGSAWVASPTLSGDLVSGDLCTFTLTPSTGAITITKTEAKKFTLTVASGGNGTVAIDGTTETSKEVNEGSKVKVTATANEGYYFNNWTVEGVVVSRSHIYSREVTTTETITANFTTEAPAKEKVYYVNTQKWDKVYCYVYGGEAGEAATWPGTEMTNCGISADRQYNVYSFESEPGAFGYCIFNPGFDEGKTSDLTWTNGKCYNNGSWETPTTANMYVGTALKCATFAAPYEITIPSGIQAYEATSIEGKWIKMNEVSTTIPAGTPVVLVANDLTDNFEQTFVGVATVTETEVRNGQLIGNLGAAVSPVPASTLTTTNYILQNNTEGTGWYKVAGSNLTCGPNRCYLTTAAENARAFYGMSFGETTGIQSVAAQAATKADGKYLVNGQIVVVKSGKAFNVNGQLVK